MIWEFQIRWGGTSLLRPLWRSWRYLSYFRGTHTYSSTQTVCFLHLDDPRHWVSVKGIESCGARFLAPRTGIAPLSFAPTRTGPKNSKFYGTDPGPTRLYFPRTGPDRNSLASTRNLKVSTRTDPKFWGMENILCWNQRDQIKFQTTINT